MAEVVDERPEETTDELEPEQITQEEPEQTTPEEDVPEKYRGKGIKDLVRMHQEVEQLQGRQAQEYGQLRREFDSYVQTQLAQAPQEPEEDIDFFTDPDAAVAKAIETHPKVKQAEQAALELQRGSAKAQLEAKHPDMQEILNDPSFADWVKASPMRAQMLQRAHQQYDFDAADFIFSDWKDRKDVATKAADVEKKSRGQQAKQASTGGAKSSSEPSSRKVYRRADIIKLMKEDPDRYESMAPEIRKAYAENRVR